MGDCARGPPSSSTPALLSGSFVVPPRARRATYAARPRLGRDIALSCAIVVAARLGGVARARHPRGRARASSAGESKLQRLITMMRTSIGGAEGGRLRADMHRYSPGPPRPRGAGQLRVRARGRERKVRYGTVYSQEKQVRHGGDAVAESGADTRGTRRASCLGATPPSPSPSHFPDPEPRGRRPAPQGPGVSSLPALRVGGWGF